MTTYRSWGYNPKNRQSAVVPTWRDFSLESFDGSLLPFGNGRSYGDSCLNASGRVIDARALDKLITFDHQCGVIRCEAGLAFKEILDIIVPNGWFLPVTPGTKFVTVGGAVANDVHGKNHHKEGTIGRHIRCFELLRSNGDRLLCSPDSNAKLFNATIGGLGLTGFISWVEMGLLPIDSPYLDVETIAFKGIEKFCELSASSHEKYHFTVAWLDCVAQGDNFARGVFMRANHSDPAQAGPDNPGSNRPDRDSNAIRNAPQRKISIPLNLPSWVVNRYSMGIFNSLYYRLQKNKTNSTHSQYYDSFFYPLDGVNNWNRIYGKNGFYQYQFVLPMAATAVLEQILKKITSSGLGSFLAVLKEFGNISSPGIMSFPKPGICLALDFANRGAFTLQVLNELDDLVMSAGGSVYPAKDNRMSSRAFRAYFPECEEFSAFIDPKFTSDFWKRVFDEQ